MSEKGFGETRVGEMRLKENKPGRPEDPAISWKEKTRKKPGEELLKNMAVAAALVLCAVALHSGAAPGMTDTTDAVLAAVSGDTLLDDHLGKLSFVSSIFPEATLVFGESTDESLVMPVSGGTVTHAWSAEEPYTCWSAAARDVCSAIDGEVLGVYHGEDEELLVQVMREDGLSCLYGNLATVAVSAGDAVKAGQTLGELLPEESCAFEVRRDGFSVDPATLMEDVPQS